VGDTKAKAVTKAAAKPAAVSKVAPASSPAKARVTVTKAKATNATKATVKKKKGTKHIVKPQPKKIPPKAQKDVATTSGREGGGWDSEAEEKEYEAMLIHDRLNVKPNKEMEKWLKTRERDTQIRMAAETMSQAEWTHYKKNHLLTKDHARAQKFREFARQANNDKRRLDKSRKNKWQRRKGAARVDDLEIKDSVEDANLISVQDWPISNNGVDVHLYPATECLLALQEYRDQKYKPFDEETDRLDKERLDIACGLKRIEDPTYNWSRKEKMPALKMSQEKIKQNRNVLREVIDKMKKFNDHCQKIEEAKMAPRVGWAAKCCRNKFQIICGAILSASTR